MLVSAFILVTTDWIQKWNSEKTKKKRFTTSVLSSSDHLLLHRGGCRSAWTPRSVSGETKSMKQTTQTHGIQKTFLGYQALWITHSSNTSSYIMCCYHRQGKAPHENTHSVYGVLVRSVKPEPAGQLRVFTSLCRWTPLFLGATCCGDVCQRTQTLLDTLDPFIQHVHTGFLQLLVKFKHFQGAFSSFLSTLQLWHVIYLYVVHTVHKVHRYFTSSQH